MADKELGQYIRERRESLRWTQKDLIEKLQARGLKRSTSSLSAWENGDHIPIQFLQTIADALQEETPLQVFYLAGLFEKIPLSNLLLLLNSLDEDKLQEIERVVRAMLPGKGAKNSP